MKDCTRFNTTVDMSTAVIKEKIEHYKAIAACHEPAEPAEKPEHYQKFYTRNLTSEELSSGVLRLHVDPYRICDILDLGGGAREQIAKKIMRWTDKGDDELQVLAEIMQACTRKIEMIHEDRKLNQIQNPFPT
jgi:hypothetical protein|tara:strand:+ start:7487 stop:7885 length:399 start_codon:yes stop_codon:yes gene_type:complete